MAARLNGAHAKDIRDKIKTTQLINRLQNYVLGDDVKLDPGQVTSALGLLKKTLPDLSAAELSGKDGDPIKHEHGIAGQRVKSLLDQIAK